MIDLFSPFVPEEAIEEVSETLRSKWIGQAHKVEKFERNFGDLFNVKYPVSLNSGTSSLETAYDLLDLKAGDEVISTPLTCTATNLPLIRRGVKIIWADILEDTLCIDPKDVLKKVTDKTKAVVQVHLGGIRAEVDDYSCPVPIVSDACQALGIFSGKYTCCSFQAIKHITTGDGGMIVLDNEQEYRKAKLLRWFGIDREKKIKENWQAYKERKMTFDIEVPGTKRHLTDIAAGMGIAGLRYYARIIEYRKFLFNTYKKELKGIDGIKIVNGDQNTYWLFTILVERRDDFARKLFENGIDNNVVQVRNDIYKVFGGKRCELPVMNRIEEKYLSLPLHMNITENDVYSICNIIKKGW